MSFVPAEEEDAKAGNQMALAKENVHSKSASSSNFHNRRSYIDTAAKNGGHNENITYTAAQQHINDSTNLMKHHKLFGPSLKINTQHVQNVIAATTNYLRKSVESSSPASTISNITPTSTNIDYLSTHEKKSNSSSTTDVGRNAYPVSTIAEAPKNLNDDDRRATLVSGPRIISESHCDVSRGVHNNDSNLRNGMGHIRPLSAVSRSSAANSIDYNTSRGLASPLGRMILRSPSPSAVNHSNNNSSSNKNNVIHFLESKSAGSSKINNMVDCENRSSSVSASWSRKLHQFKHNVDDSNTFKRIRSSNSLVRESFSSSSDDVSLDIETSSFEDSIIDRRNKPDFQRSRSVDFVNQQMLSNAKKSGNKKKGRIQTREKSLSSDISFDGEIRSISIRRKLSEVCDEDDGDAFFSSIDRSSMMMHEKDPGHVNRFKSISNSRKRQQDGSPCEFEAPPKITAKSNLSCGYNNNANNQEVLHVPSPPQKIRQHFVHSDLDLPPLRRTQSPNFMQGVRGRSRVIVPRGIEDSSHNNGSDNMIQEKFLSIKHLPSPSPPAKIIDPSVTPIVTTATTMDPNNVDICGLSSLDDDDNGRQSMPPPLPISTPLPMEEPEFLLPTVDSGNGCTLKTVSCETVNRLLNGEFNDTVKKYIIVDCRFEYEYTGGHILNAINIVKPEHAIEKFFKEQIHDIDTCILFHCEFSSHRAPKMMKEVRNLDRKLHENSYPQLYYPQLYLIKGGYKEFYNNFIEKCEPRAYVEMLHGDFKDVCKSTASLVRKSWKRHKSFDMDLLRHSSPALLSTINQFDSTNVERINCENNPRDVKNKRLRKANKSLSTFSRTRRGVNLFANDDENNGGKDGNGRSNIVSRSIINRTTSFSEGYADITVPPIPFFGTCRGTDKERQRGDEREANTF
eukprot:g9705.t1